MNILPSIYRGFTPFTENSFLSPLNRPERKISMLALGIIFGCLAAGCALYFIFFRRRARVIKNEEQPKVASSAETTGLRRPSAELSSPIVPVPVSPPNLPLTSSLILSQSIVGLGSTSQTSSQSSHQNRSADLDSKEEMNGNGVDDKTNGHHEEDDSKTNGAVAIVNGAVTNGFGDIHESKESSPEDVAFGPPIQGANIAEFAKTEKKYVKGLIDFVFEWFRRISDRTTPNNDLVSPLGVSQLLSIIRIGASTDIRRQMDHFTHLPGNAFEILRKVSEIIKNLKSSGLSILNLIYLNSKYQFAEAYIKHVAGYQAQAVRGVSFEEINSCVARATNGLIPGSLKKNEIHAVGFNCLLLNAMHLRAHFSDSFEVANDQLESFATSFGSIKMVKMMRKVGKFNYFQDKECQAIRLPYGGDKSNFSLLLVLPKAVNNFQFMSTYKFTQIWEGLKGANVSFAMPHFALNHRINLAKEFEIARVGIVLDSSLMRKDDPTVAKKAPISALAAKETWSPSQIFQELSFSCNENGSEVPPPERVDGKTNGHLELNENKETLVEEAKDGRKGKLEVMHCNRPFLAVVVENTNNLPVLLAIVRDPTQPNKIGSTPGTSGV